jgi:RNA polymerase sigma-70 factor (ECF subfamily)
MDEKIRDAARCWTLAQPIVSAYVCAVVRDVRDRDDVLQEIAVAVLESFDSYDPSRSLAGWTLGIARNKIGTYLRQRRRHRLYFNDETLMHLADAMESTAVDPTGAMDALQGCMSELEGRARHLCALRYENDLKPAAIAELLGMNPNAVAKALQRVREQIRACMERKTVWERSPG